MHALLAASKSVMDSTSKKVLQSGGDYPINRFPERGYLGIYIYICGYIGFRVHLPNNQVLGIWVIVIIRQVLRKYTSIG